MEPAFIQCDPDEVTAKWIYVVKYRGNWFTCYYMEDTNKFYYDGFYYNPEECEYIYKIKEGI